MKAKPSSPSCVFHISQNKIPVFSLVLVLFFAGVCWWLNNFYNFQHKFKRRSVRKVKPIRFLSAAGMAELWEKFKFKPQRSMIMAFCILCAKEKWNCKIKNKKIFSRWWSNARIYIHLKRIKLKAFITFFILCTSIYLFYFLWVGKR